MTPKRPRWPASRSGKTIGWLARYRSGSAAALEPQFGTPVLPASQRQ